MILLREEAVGEYVGNDIEVESGQHGMEGAGQPLLEFIESGKGPFAQACGYQTRGPVPGNVQQQPAILLDKACDYVLSVKGKIIEMLNEFVCSCIMIFHKHRLRLS